MKRVYYLARIEGTDYLLHGYTWEHKLDDHLDRISLPFATHIEVIHTVETHSVGILKRKINSVFSMYKVPETSLLYIDTPQPIIEIMDEYDGETIDPHFSSEQSLGDLGLE